MTLFEAILLTVITASTPLLIAAIGELVVERAGVAQSRRRGHDDHGRGVRLRRRDRHRHRRSSASLAAIAAGIAMSLIFAVLTLGLAANQVASGLALTIFGLGLSGVIGAALRRRASARRCRSSICPCLSDIPFIGPIVFAQDPFVYLSIALVVGVVVVPDAHARRARAARLRREPRVRPCAGLSRC